MRKEVEAGSQVVALLLPGGILVSQSLDLGLETLNVGRVGAFFLDENDKTDDDESNDDKDSEGVDEEHVR